MLIIGRAAPDDTLASLQAAAEAGADMLEFGLRLTPGGGTLLLTEVLDRWFGNIVINIVLKSRGAGEQAVQLLQKHYITKASDWDNVLISSLSATELVRVRRLAPHANLALIHDKNPFAFIAYYRFIKFTAVGFHRLHCNPLAVQIARRAELFTYAYTVNRPGALPHLAGLGIDGIVTNYPDKFV